MQFYRHRFGFSKFTLMALLAGLLTVSCDFPWDPGPMPTDIEKTEFVPGLNILGILRADGNAGSSFFRVERAYELSELTKDMKYYLPLEEDAKIVVKDSLTKDSDSFYWSGDRFYRNSDFTAQTGHEYQLRVTSSEFPVLEGVTIIPEPPQVELIQTTPDSGVVVTVTPDEFTAMVDVYLIYSNGRDIKRLINRDNQPLTMKFDINDQLGQLIALEVFAYDQNLAAYLQADITIKPQTYQQMVTTVTGGYGCFGSLTETRISF